MNIPGFWCFTCYKIVIKVHKIVFMNQIMAIDVEVVDMVFMDKIHIQICMNCTLLVFNPTSEKVVTIEGKVVIIFNPILF